MRPDRARSGRAAGPVTTSVLAAVLTAVLAGCSAGGQEPSDAGKIRAGADRTPKAASPGRAASEGPSAPAAPPGRDAHGPSEKPEQSSDRTEAPKIPRDELAPVTGSFTAEEKDYLQERVPRGIDPAAVLVGGKETCARIGRTAKVDRAAAVDAIRSGEIAGAGPAVTHLCPQYGDLLRDARN